VSTPPDPDEELMDELRSVLARVDPVPAEVTEFAKAALGWRRLDAELAELLADSVLEADSAAGVRSEGGSRWITFRSADLAIDLELQIDGDSRLVLGQLAPPLEDATIEVQTADGMVLASARSDALGRFRLEVSAGGTVRLRVTRPAGPAVETSWLSV
jgi:hypothetical protein